MSLVLQFSKYIAIPILSEWLNGVDFIVFYVALCNHPDQRILLNWYSEYSNVFDKIFLSSSSPTDHIPIQSGKNSRRPSNVIGSLTFNLDVAIMNEFLRVSEKELNHLPIFFKLYNYFYALYQQCGLHLSVSTFMQSVFHEFFWTTSLFCFHDYDSEYKVSQLSCFYSGEKGVDFNLLIRCCPLLTDLDVGNCDANIAVICLHAKNLKWLGISGLDLSRNKAQRRTMALFCFHSQCCLETLENSIDWDDLYARVFLWYKGRQLSSLHFEYSSFGDIVLKDIHLACPNITFINIILCDRLHDEGLVPMFNSYTALTKLDLEVQSDVTDATIIAATTKNVNLESIWIMCTPFTSHGLSTISNCLQLISLSLNNMYALNDEAMIKIVSHCRLLTNIDINTHYVDDDNIEETSQYIYLYLTDKSLHAMAKYCTSTLQEFHFTCCNNITDTGLTALLTSCTELDNIYIHNCSQITMKPHDKFIYGHCRCVWK